MFYIGYFHTLENPQNRQLRSLITSNGPASKNYYFLKRTAQEILGSYYSKLKEFYWNIFSDDDYQYIVFVARKSIGLAELFFHILWNEALADKNNAALLQLESAWARSATDSTIMSYAGNIADMFQNRRYPKILVVDDVLIQGNSMNELLSGIERNVILELHKRGVLDDTTRVGNWWSNVVNSIQIKVFAQNEKLSVINLHYQMRLRPESILKPTYWHDFSQRVTNLFTATGTANATFIMSAEIDLNDNTTGDCINRVLLNRHLTDTLPISVITHDPDSLFERHYLGWRPDTDSGVPYYCTLRLIKNCYTNSYRLLPFVFLPKLEPEQYLLLKKRVSFRWGIRDLDASRLGFEAIILHLSTSLMMSWCRYAGINLTPDELDWMKVSMNYGLNQGQSIIHPNDFEKLAEPGRLFDWPELQELLDEITCDSRKLCDICEPKEFCDDQTLCKKMEDWIYRMKVQELTESYRSFTTRPPDLEEINGLTLKENRKLNWNIPLEIYLHSIMSASNNAPIDSIFANLLSFMDYGVLTLRIRKDRVQDTPEDSYEQVLRMASQSLTLWPKRYRKYHLVLKHLEQRRLRYRTSLEAELGMFLEYEQKNGKLPREINAESLTKELTEYLKRLRQSGQELDDWDIRFERPAVLHTYQKDIAARTREYYRKEQMHALQDSSEARQLLHDCRAIYRA